MNICLHHREHALWGGILIFACSLMAAQIGHQCVQTHTIDIPLRPLVLPVATELNSPHEHLEEDLTDSTGSMELLVDAVIMLESGGHPDLVGRAGERGLMQIMPATWAACSQEVYGKELSFDLAFDPEINRRVGTYYLRRMQQFLAKNGAHDRTDSLHLLLACYNAGPERVYQGGFQMDGLPSSTISYARRGVALFESLCASPRQNQMANAMRNRDS